jgi:hypothetical protein
MVCLRNISVDTLHKGFTEDDDDDDDDNDNDDDDDNNNNNNNNNNNTLTEETPWFRQGYLKTTGSRKTLHSVRQITLGDILKSENSKCIQAS